MLRVKGKVAEEVLGGRQAAPLILETKENQSSFISVATNVFLKYK